MQLASQLLLCGLCRGKQQILHDSHIHSAYFCLLLRCTFFASCVEPIIPANAPIPSSRHGLLSPSQIGMCPNTLNHRDGALSKITMEPTVTAVSSASPRRSMVGLTIYDFSQRQKRLVIDKHRHCASQRDTRVSSVYPGENQTSLRILHRIDRLKGREISRKEKQKSSSTAAQLMKKDK